MFMIHRLVSILLILDYIIVSSYLSRMMKMVSMQRARADARALADKVAALEAENARLRQAASPPSGAKTPNTEDDWEQCVDETTGHTYYYSSSRDASRWEMPSAWKEGGPKDDWEQC